jgi:hypothetical protein
LRTSTWSLPAGAGIARSVDRNFFTNRTKKDASENGLAAAIQCMDHEEPKGEAATPGPKEKPQKNNAVVQGNFTLLKWFPSTPANDNGRTQEGCPQSSDGV